MLEYHLLSINMWSIWLWVFLSREVHEYLRRFRRSNFVLFTNEVYDVPNFVILVPLLLLSWCRLSFPIVGLKIFSLPKFALKSPVRIYILYLGKLLIICFNYSWIISFLLTWCMHIQKSDITLSTSQHYIWHPIGNKLYSINCYILFCGVQRILLTIDDLHFIFINKLCSPALTVPALSYLTFAHPLNIISIHPIPWLLL